ncbi:hypothetical protein ABT247_13590 [Kitasatospora sp. NPDC001539]|uniref:hypothetical protein n=1 Tax=unclassified Kitasatospora TaxID=2633591 RepID=UPI003324D272
MSRVLRREALRYLLVESQESATEEALAFVGDGVAQARGGHEVTLFLVQGGVSLALGHRPELSDFVEAGGRLLVDRFSVDQRGISAALRPDAVPVEMDAIARLVLDPEVRTVWH